MKKLQVLHLLDLPLRKRVGGVERFVELISPDPSLVLSRTPGDRFGLLSLLRAKIIQQKADVFHIHQLLPWGIPSLIRLCRSNPCVFTLHDYFPFCQKVHFLKFGKICKKSTPLACCACTNRVFSPFHFLYYLLRKKLVEIFFDSLCLIVLPNPDLIFLIPKKFHPKCRVIPYAVEKPKNKEEKNRQHFVYLGSNSDHKGIFELITQMKNLKNFQDHLHIYGEGFSDSPALLNSKICEYRGVLKNHDLLQNYKALILPSIWQETGPLVLQEALHRKTPVLAKKGSITTFWHRPGVFFYENEKELNSLLSSPLPKITECYLPDLFETRLLHQKTYLEAKNIFIARKNGFLEKIYDNTADI